MPPVNPCHIFPSLPEALFRTHPAYRPEQLQCRQAVAEPRYLRTRSWDDPKINSKRYVTEIIAWQFVVPGKDPVTISTTGVPITDDDVPF